MSMRFAFLLFAAAILSTATSTTAEARRVALVIGQDAYPGGSSATVGLPPLHNSLGDARRFAKLLGAHGFEVIACDGKTGDGNEPGCLDQTRAGLERALTTLTAKAQGAEMALVYFAGHGLATEEGNILTPTDAKLDCKTGAVTHGIAVERFMAAVAPARHKLMILDACRDNPVGDVCPGLKGKKLSFTRIEAGALQNFLLVTSTQFGQQALDGPKGAHSPFATALFAALEANPAIYFEQVMNEVARATYDAAQKQQGFVQIPGKVVGGAAPADCLAGKACVGDVRMSALAREMETLAAESTAAKADAAGLRAIIAADENARGKPYTPEERAKRIAELGSTLASIGASGDPLRQEAKRLLDQGNVAGGTAKLDAALDAEEKAAADAERLVAEKKKAAARSARDLAVLARGSNVAKAADYYKRATGLDPSDAQTWDDYARAAIEAGRLGEAKTAFEQAAAKARDAGQDRHRYWATLGMGDVAKAHGNLPSARRLYETAAEIADRLAKADPGNSGWQRDLSVSYNKIGDVLVAQGQLPDALKTFRDSLAIADKLAKADHGNSGRQRDLSVSYDHIGDVLVAQGNLPDALKAFRDSLAIADKLAKADPGNAGWQRDLSVSQERIGDVLIDQGQLTDALKAYRDSLAIRDKLAKADPGNAKWQRDLSVSQEKIGDVLVDQGQLTDAFKAFRDGLVIRDKLAKADPGNAGWQRDLSVSYNKIGDVLVAQGQLPDALKAFRDSLAIRDRLAKADPGNAGWQRDLSVSYNKIGDVLVAQGNLPDALKAFRDSLAIADKLAKADPGNAGWQRDHSVSTNKVGDVLVAQGQLPDALKAFTDSLAIRDKLAKADPGNAGWQRDLSVSYIKVGNVLVAQGQLPDALKAYRDSQAIFDKLAKADPGNAGWQRDLSYSHDIIASLLERQGEREEALRFAEKSLAIDEGLAARDPSNVTWQKDVTVSRARVERLKGK